MKVEQLEPYLLKVNYSGQDIQELAGVKRTHATKIMSICRSKYNGAVIGRPYVVTAKSYWLYEGTTLEEQLRLLAIAKGNG
ncbi:MAG: hypothetical protein M0Q41_13395 [Bacteroidales bacterium]|nr:hypothetical protein [Acholeplasmataceae bacterium]MCK9449951.1 hypothetical protein [Bacteroidales bacterium]